MCADPHRYSFAWKQNPGSARSGLFPLGEELVTSMSSFPAPAGKELAVGSNKEIWCILSKHECVQGLEHRGGLAFPWIFCIKP